LVLLGAAPARAGKLESFGLRTGLSTSHLAGDFGKSIGGDYRSGFTAAAGWRFRLTDRFSFAPEVAWVARGGDGNLRFVSPGPSTQVTDYSIENRFHYVEFPILLRVDLPAARAIRPYLVAGPAPAVKAGVRQVVETTTRSGPGATTPQIQYAIIFEPAGTLGNQRVEAIDLGLVGGAGVTLGSGRARLAIEGRYTHGLLDVIDGGVESRNRGFAATLGVELH
jgi:hypothetical protein